jgi:hypothetical protein
VGSRGIGARVSAIYRRGSWARMARTPRGCGSGDAASCSARTRSSVLLAGLGRVLGRPGEAWPRRIAGLTWLRGVSRGVQAFPCSVRLGHRKEGNKEGEEYDDWGPRLVGERETWSILVVCREGKTKNRSAERFRPRGETGRGD